MDWWQAGSVMGTVVLSTTAVATFGWRVLRQAAGLTTQTPHNHRPTAKLSPARVVSIGRNSGAAPPFWYPTR